MTPSVSVRFFPGREVRQIVAKKKAAKKKKK
jgi:hypothetical protein